MTRSERLRRRIIWHLRHVWTWYEGNCWKSFSALADELGTTVPIIKREVRRLAKAGRLSYSWMVDGDLKACGSGYFLTTSWQRHQPGREEDPTDEEFAS